MREIEGFPLDELPQGEKLMNVDGEPTMVQYDSRRGIGSYEQIFHLKPKDMEDKVVVDLGSSQHQTFAEEVGRSTLYKPKTLISVDPLAEFKEKDDLHVVSAKAEAMPFKENIDLILASNSVPLYLRTPASIVKAFEEIIDSIKIGGEARIFPLAYSPHGDEFDPEKNIIRPSKIVYPPNDEGVFDDILHVLQQKYQIQVIRYPVWVRDLVNPDEKIMLQGLDIKKTGENNEALPFN